MRSEVVQQSSLPVKHLHHAPEPIDYIKVSFRVQANSLWTKHASGAIPNAANFRLKSSGAIQELHAKIHGVDHKQILIADQHLGRQIELDLAVAAAPDGLQHRSVHIEHKHFVAQCVGDVDPLRLRV